MSTEINELQQRAYDRAGGRCEAVEHHPECVPGLVMRPDGGPSYFAGSDCTHVQRGELAHIHGKGMGGTPETVCPDCTGTGRGQRYYCTEWEEFIDDPVLSRHHCREGVHQETLCPQCDGSGRRRLRDHILNVAWLSQKCHQLLDGSSSPNCSDCDGQGWVSVSSGEFPWLWCGECGGSGRQSPEPGRRRRMAEELAAKVAESMDPT